MAKDINLLDEHRIGWLHLVGKTKRFRGTVARFGHKHRQGAEIKKGATLMLVNVHLVGSPKVIDHVWVDYRIDLAKFGEHIRPNGEIEFTATVASYEKGGANIYGKGTGTFDDLGLEDLHNVKIIHEPFLPKAYLEHALIDDELVRYAIITKTNTKSGTVIGTDPKGYLGKIRVGQGFANRVARTLSYNWHVVMPSKYQFKS